MRRADQPAAAEVGLRRDERRLAHRVDAHRQPGAGLGVYSAASRPASAASTDQPVSVMPSGSSTLACRYSSKRWPLITSTTRPSTSSPIEYCHSRTGLEQQRQAGERVADPLEVGVRRAPLEAGLAVQRVDGMGVHEPVGQPGGVAEQLPQLHLLDLRVEHRPLRRAGPPHLRVGERRQVLGDGILELEATLLPQRQRGDRGDRLGHRVDPPDGVEVDRRSRPRRPRHPAVDRWTILPWRATQISQPGNRPSST